MHAYNKSEEDTAMWQSPVSGTSPIFIENLLKKFQFPLLVNVIWFKHLSLVQTSFQPFMHILAYVLHFLS